DGSRQPNGLPTPRHAAIAGEIHVLRVRRGERLVQRDAHRGVVEAPGDVHLRVGVVSVEVRRMEGGIEVQRPRAIAYRAQCGGGELGDGPGATGYDRRADDVVRIRRPRTAGRPTLHSHVHLIRIAGALVDETHEAD